MFEDIEFFSYKFGPFVAGDWVCGFRVLGSRLVGDITDVEGRVVLEDGSCSKTDQEGLFEGRICEGYGNRGQKFR